MSFFLKTFDIDLTDYNSVENRIQPKMRSKVLYKIKCGDCGDFYGGKISSNLITRINEHKTEKNSSLLEMYMDLVWVTKSIGKVLRSWTVQDQIAYYY